MVKHVTSVVRGAARSIDGRPYDPPERAAEFTMTGADRLADLTADLDRAAAELRAAAADEALDRELPIEPAPWMPDLPTLPIRHRLAHMIDEIARHTGQADILRETLDGADAGSLMAAVEHWPANPWIMPWTPKV